MIKDIFKDIIKIVQANSTRTLEGLQSNSHFKAKEIEKINSAIWISANTSNCWSYLRITQNSIT